MALIIYQVVGKSCRQLLTCLVFIKSPSDRVYDYSHFTERAKGGTERTDIVPKVTWILYGQIRI